MPRLLHNFRRSLGSFAAITRNRLTGRTFVPHPRRELFIETTARCNLACRFCAYPNRGPGEIMALDRFEKILAEAAAMGFETIWLTPMLGDVFTDPGWAEKFAALEARAEIKHYGFYTNFILPSPEAVRTLSTFDKLGPLFISIYGHDRETFERVTQKNPKQFDRLMENLQALLKDRLSGRQKSKLHFNIRTVNELSKEALPSGPLVQLLNRFEREAGASVRMTGEYDTWGGSIPQERVDPIGIVLTDGSNIYKRGACALMFLAPQVMADGTVHACACRDFDGSLRLGSLAEKPLKTLLSSTNPRFAELAAAQQAGRFGPNCRSCAVYRSIYDHRASQLDPNFEVMTLCQALAVMA